MIFDSEIHFEDIDRGYIAKIYELDSEDAYKISATDLENFHNKVFSIIKKEEFDLHFIFRPQWDTKNLRQKAHLIVQFVRKKEKMNKFEQIYQTDPSRENKIEIEDGCIELSDEQYLKNIRISKGLTEEGFVFREPCTVDENSSDILKQKFALAEQLTKPAKIVNLRGKDEKIKSKIPKKSPKKSSSKSNSTTIKNKK